VKPDVFPSNSITIEKSKDVVWKELIPEIGNAFWVINNLDKESGLINISYIGDPIKYIDCGSMKFEITNARGTRAYEFQGASANEIFETMDHGVYLGSDKSHRSRINSRSDEANGKFEVYSD
jgi:hypothetical protein